MENAGVVVKQTEPTNCVDHPSRKVPLALKEQLKKGLSVWKMLVLSSSKQNPQIV